MLGRIEAVLFELKQQLLLPGILITYKKYTDWKGAEVVIVASSCALGSVAEDRRQCLSYWISRVHCDS